MANHLPLELVLFIGASIILQAATAGHWSSWGAWSECSVTCGRGLQSRKRICINQVIQRCAGRSSEWKRCREEFCPSYLDWPRINFKGAFVADTTTSNNYRCFYDSDSFSPISNTIRAQVDTNRQYFKGPNIPKVHPGRETKNPMGTGHFYFRETYVTSACWEPNVTCSDNDPIVGRKVQGLHDGVMVDIDVDWQWATSIYGYDIHIPGVMNGHMVPSSVSQLSNRMRGGWPGQTNSYKTKLVNITWIDDYYKNKFKNSTKLSIKFILDGFHVYKYVGRVAGTIGMTSPDDPLSAFAGRIMRTRHRQRRAIDVTFHINKKHRIMTIDMAAIAPCENNGSFIVKDFKYLDVVVLPSSDGFCDDVDCDTRAVSCEGYDLFLLTKGGALDITHTTNEWYTVYGGLVNIQLKWTSDDTMRILSNSRIGIVDRSSLHDTSDALTYTLCSLLPSRCSNKKNSQMKCKLIALEGYKGINYKLMVNHVHRLSRGRVWNAPVIASSFNRPLSGARIDFRITKRALLRDICERSRYQCNPLKAEPKSAIKLSDPAYTDQDGIAQMSIKVIKNPGNFRGCGLDGQLYPVGVFLQYDMPNGAVIRVGDGGVFINAFRNYTMSRAESECNVQTAYFTFPMAFKVYSSLPSSIMRKKCPSWNDDVRYIFDFYYRVAPVMQRRGIVNLRNIDDVRSKLHMINMSMFEYDFEHPNFMPPTRDLSPDKTEVVRRWIECEARGLPETETSSSSKTPRSSKHTVEKICGSPKNLKTTTEDLRDLLQFAMWIELYIIPPYLTAYFSLKPESNKEVRTLLKSIATEEMLHLSLGANVLNAIGGKPNLTDSYWLPNYPTGFPSKNFFQIKPGMILKLKRYSTLLAKEVFSEIEKPAPPEVLNVIHSVALLWQHLPDDSGGRNSVGMNNGSIRRWQKESTRANNETSFNSSTTFWEEVFEFSSDLLEEAFISDVYTISGYYAHVMLRILQAEACVKINSTNQTFFTGDPGRQLGFRQWYVQKGLSSAILFPVTGLKSAIEGLLEIVYEGEGGTPCAPVISDFNVNFRIVPENHNLYRSVVMPSQEKSHYMKFQELAHERELVSVAEEFPPWSDIHCLEQNPSMCGCQLLNSSMVTTSSPDLHQHTCRKFCFSGKSLAFKESEGVWPMELFAIHIRTIVTKNITHDTYEVYKHFNNIYTNMLHCLESSMNGEPTKMATCIGNMYELVYVGKKLVRMPIYQNVDPYIGPTATPGWAYVRDKFKQEGLQYSPPTEDIIFC